MQYLGSFKYTNAHIFFSFPVFVVWKTTVDREKKDRAVVNIWNLNYLVIPNAYPLLLQSDIIARVQECTNLAVFDIAFIFYQ